MRRPSRRGRRRTGRRRRRRARRRSSAPRRAPRRRGRRRPASRGRPPAGCRRSPRCRRGGRDPLQRHHVADLRAQRRVALRRRVLHRDGAVVDGRVRGWCRRPRRAAGLRCWASRRRARRPPAGWRPRTRRGSPTLASLRCGRRSGRRTRRAGCAAITRACAARGSRRSIGASVSSRDGPASASSMVAWAEKSCPSPWTTSPTCRCRAALHVLGAGRNRRRAARRPRTSGSRPCCSTGAAAGRSSTSTTRSLASRLTRPRSTSRCARHSSAPRSATTP